MNLAAASGVAVGRVSDILTDVITAMGDSSKDSARYADIMSTVSAKSNTNVDLLGDTFKYASQIAGTLGIKMEDLSIAVGLMANSSVKGRQAGTSLRGGLVNMVKPTEKQADAMEKYNIGLIKNKDGTVNLRATMINLRKQVKGLNKDTQANVLATLFGKEALSGWSAIVNASEKDFNDMAKAIDNSTGATEKMKDTMLKNTKGDITIMLSSIEGALIAVFRAIAPVVTNVANTITDLANKFSSLTEDTQGFIVKAMGIAALIGPVLKLTGGIVTMGAKLRAIPVALKKMNDRSIERQVNAWLKWNKVSDSQAAKLRKVARDLDKVKRDGTGATTASNRLNNELRKIRMKEQPAREMKNLARGADKAEKEVKELKRELNSVKSKNVRVNTKISKSGSKGKGKGIGKDIANDLITEIGGELGASALSGIGGEIFGEILGEGLAEGLSSMALGTGALKGQVVGVTGALKGLLAGIGPVGWAIAGVTTAVTAGAVAIKKYKEGMDILSGGSGVAIDGTRKKFEAMAPEVEKALNPILEKLYKIEKLSNGKYKIEINTDYDENKTEKLLKDIEKIQTETKKTTEEMFGKDSIVTETVGKQLDESKERYEKYSKELSSINKRLNDGMKKGNVETLDLTNQQYRLSAQIAQEAEISKALAVGASEEEIQEIRDKHHASYNQQIMSSTNNAIANAQKVHSKEMQLIQASIDKEQERHDKEMKAIEETTNYSISEKEALKLKENKLFVERMGALEREAEHHNRMIDSEMQGYDRLITSMVASGQITENQAKKLRSEITQVTNTKAEVQFRSNVNDVRSSIAGLISDVKRADGMTAKVGIYQDVRRTIYDALPKGVDHPGNYATGGQMASGYAITGERGPELISKKGGNVEIQPLRATDRAMGGWKKSDLALGEGGDVFYVTIEGHNKTAKELFDEIENYKTDVKRTKEGSRSFRR